VLVEMARMEALEAMTDFQLPPVAAVRGLAARAASSSSSIPHSRDLVA
jgi:hypothetical protein